MISCTGGVFSLCIQCMRRGSACQAQAAEVLDGVVTVQSLTAGTFFSPSGDLDIVTLDFEAVAGGITEIFIDPFRAFGEVLMLARAGLDGAVFDPTETARIVV